MNELTASVLITSKNRKEDLIVAIESCLTQKRCIEVIVIDDGSDDGSSEEVQSRFPEVRLVREEVSGGYIIRRNEGVFMAKGDIVFIIDDDAIFTTPDVISQTLEEFSDDKIGAIAVPFVNVNESEEVYQLAPDKDNMWITSSFRGTAQAVRKDVFEALGGFRKEFIHQGEEGEYCLRMLDAGYYVRLGSSDCIHHFESPKRDFKKRDVFGRRNDIFGLFLNLPILILAVYLPLVILNGLYFGIKQKTFFNMLEGVFAGFSISLKNLHLRKVIKASSYRNYRKLRHLQVAMLSDFKASTNI